MAGKGRFSAALLLGLIICCLAAYLTFDAYLLSERRQNLQGQLAELNSIRYGLLNDEIWNDRISGVLSERLATMDFSQTNRSLIEGAVEGLLNYLVQDLDQIISPGGDGNNNWLQQAITTIAFDIALDTAMLKAQVPLITDEILRKLENGDTQIQLKSFLQARLQEIAIVPESGQGRHQRALAQQLGCESVDDCKQELSAATGVLSDQIRRRMFLVLACSLLVFLLCVLQNGSKLKGEQFLLLLGVSTILLAGGLALPMIDIDARIQEIQFNLLGTETVFTDQVLFFQSKSILEVVQILLQNGDGPTLLVGCLVLAFSIIFPLAKITATTYAVRNPGAAQRGWLHFLIFQSGKWSMADVMVVAIFMAFIGFRGILSSQLQQLQSTQAEMNIVTTHEFTTLQAGFFLFAGFCVMSLVIAQMFRIQVEDS